MTITLKKTNDELLVQTNNNQKLKEEMEKLKKEKLELSAKIQQIQMEYEKLQVNAQKFETSLFDIFNETYTLYVKVHTIESDLDEGDFDAPSNPYHNFAKEQIPIKIEEYLKDMNKSCEEI